MNIVKNLLIMLNNPQQMCLKLLQKEQFKKQQKELVIWLVVKLLIKLQKFQKIHNKMIQTKLQMRNIKKYLNKDMSPETRQDCWWNEINKFVGQYTKSTN